VILGFPVVAGAVITTFGYQTVFVVLFCLAAAACALGLRPSPLVGRHSQPATKTGPLVP
jgi:hypothetical protein